MPDPDLQIRGEVIQTLRKGGARSPKTRLFGPQFGLKIGGRGSPGLSPGSTTERSLLSLLKILFFTRHLEAKRSVVVHFNSLDLNSYGIISFEEFEEDMAQERSKIGYKNVQI